jgi:3-isopropylmalate/(R)-2-methylmalate dehydratase large subunit
VRQWCADNGVDLFERRGIGHQVAAEAGYAVPGGFAVHFDGHVSGLGAFGTLAIGLRRNVIEAFAREHVSMTVPATSRVDLEGTLPRGVMARDLFHHLTRTLGRAGCRFQVLELGGPAIEGISIDGWQSVCGLAMFVGAITAIINPGERILAYSAPRARKRLAPMYSDPDAEYSARHRVNLAALEPLVVAPADPGNVKPLRDYIGTRIDVGYLGSCVSGRIEDLRAAAQVLKGRKVKAGFALYVVPTSQEIMVQAAAEGLIEEFARAGAFVSSPTCDYCYGRIGTMAAGQRAVSTGTLNVRGRMGSPQSEIYLCNAAAVAAAAIEGSIVDPRDYLPADEPTAH